MGNYHVPKICERCGMEFIAQAPNAKYCMPCRPFAEEDRKYWHDESRRIREKQRRAEKVMARYKGLDDTLKECKEQGLTYAEAQRAKTLAMIPRIEI